MNATFARFSGSDPPRGPQAPPQETEGQSPPPSQRTGSVWFRLIRWIQENTFAPQWLPKHLRHPLVGYLAAALVELAAVSVILLLITPFPSFDFYVIFTLVGAVIMALGWGAGPSLFATLVSTLLLDFFVVLPQFSWKIADPADALGLVLYLAVGSSIGLLAGQSERARRRAEKTAQLLAQAEARSSLDAERLRTVLEVLPSAVLIASQEGQLLAMNQASKTLWGGDIAPGTDITHYSQSNQFKAWRVGTGQPLEPEEWTLVRTLSSGQAVLNDEIEIEALDGQRRTILNSAAPIRDETGTVISAVISAQDISALRRLEREAAARAQELEAIFETINDGIFVYDAQGHITHLNAAGREIVGPEEVSFLSQSPEERAARRRALDEMGRPLPLDHLPNARILRGEVLTGARAVDVYISSPEGHIQTLSASGTPLRSEEGAITGAVVVTRDVTDRRRLEREAAERAQELEAIFETMTDGIASLDRQGRLVRTNQAYRSLHAAEQHPDFLTVPVDQRLAALDLRDEQGQSLAVEARPISRILQGETLTGVDYKVKNLEGREMVLNVSGTPIRDQLGQVTGSVQVFRDVTARQHLEQRTRESLEALVAMAEAMVQVRPATLAAESVDAPSALVADKTLPQVARRLAELTRSALGCRSVSIAAVDTPTGWLHPVTEVGLAPEQEQEWWSSWSPLQHLKERYDTTIAAALSAGEPVLLDARHLPQHSEYSLYQAQTVRILPMRLGEELVGTLLVVYPEPGHEYTSPQELLLTGTLARLGALVVERDHLLRGWAEARANELALGETKAQMDAFLGIASHELKTPLTSLKLSLQLSERRLQKLRRAETGASAAGKDAGLQPTIEQLSRAERQMERLERLVNDLLDVSRIQAGKLELQSDDADLAAIVKEVVLEQREATPDRRIRLRCPVGLQVQVYGDAGRIEQVVTNFLTNALKYSPADRPVDVGVQIEHEHVRVWVRDYGPGLPPEEQERIWERFHRAKGVEVQSGAGVGLGLGLHISRMIIERHHGQVGVESAPGQGSTFWFTLPLSTSSEDD